MKIKSVVLYNNKKWKILAIVGGYARIRLIGKGAKKIVCLKDLKEGF